MAHHLEVQEDGSASFAYNVQGGDPWHTLGTPMEGAQDLPTMLKMANADYEVFTAPILASISAGVGLPDLPDTEEPILTPTDRHVATCRKNPVTGALEVLGVVGAGYVPVQNRECAERALAIVAAENDAVIDTMGVLFDGRRFFTCIDLGSLFIDPQGINDEVKKYLGVYTGHDGSMAVTYFNDNVRVVCYNTVTAAAASAKEAGAKRYFSARHTTNVRSAMDDGLRAFALAEAWGEAFERQASALLATPGGRNRLDLVLNEVFPVPDAAEVSKRVLTTAQARRDDIHALYSSSKNAGGFGENGWTIFNTVGEYLDHARKGSATAKATASMTPGSWVDAAKRQVASILVNA